MPLETVASLGVGDRPASGHMLAVHGAQVSALHRVAGVLEVRVFDPTDAPAVVSFAGRSGWLVDLRGYPVAPFEATFELRPFGIATVRPTTTERARERTSSEVPGVALSRRSPTPRSSSRSREYLGETFPAHIPPPVGLDPGAVRLPAGPATPPQLHPAQVLERRGRRACAVNSPGASASRARWKSSDINTVPGLPMFTIRWARFTVGPK